MIKPRPMPALASAAIALSLAACQGMGGGEAGGAQQTSAAASPAYSAMQSQAAAPDLVRNVQNVLHQRGYHTGPVDGIYGESTQQALRNFQRDQKLNNTGQIDTQTLAALGVVGEGARASGTARQEYTPTSRRGAAVEQPRRTSSTNLSSGQVRDLQQELASRGYDSGPVDGLWGPRTQQAVRQFQQDQKLAASGRPDKRTLAALGIEGAGTQTGAAPDEPPAPREEMRRQDEGIQSEELRREETGQLPETEAPGIVRPSERMGGTEGLEPDVPRSSTPDAPDAETPAPPGTR